MAGTAQLLVNGACEIERGKLRITMQTNPRAAPAPHRRAIHKLGAPGVALDVAADDQQVLILFNDERFVSPLIQRAVADGVPGVPPAPHNRGRPSA